MMHKLMIIALLVIAPGLQAAERFSINELGPLFTTAKERQQLDNRRAGSTPTEVGEQRRTPSTITVNGIVKRSDGQSTVWINGRSDADRRTRNGVKVSKRHSRDDSVAVYVDGRLVRIKPGESWSDKGAGQQSGN